MGGEAKVTVMVLKVDLGCTKCCRKIKRVLCSTPQVRDQLFDEKSNTVTCSVICCTPEIVADKIRKKAGGTVKGIEIKATHPPAKPPAEKPKELPPPPQADKPKQGPPPHAAEKPKAAQPPADKPKADEKPKSAPPPADKPKSDDKPKAVSAPPPADKPKSDDKPKPVVPSPGDGNPDKPKKAEAPPTGPPPQQQMPMSPPPQSAMKPNQPAAFMSAETIPVAGYPSIFPPVLYYDGGPYYQNQGMGAMAAPQMFPHQPVYQYDGYQGRPVGDYYGGNGGRGHRSDYFSEDNPTTCSVM
ncbi:unnamed protein product [Rhodiola kirilowii]